MSPSPDELSPEAQQFARDFARLSPADQETISRLLELLTDNSTRTLVECLVLACGSLDEARLAVPGLRWTQ